MAIAFERTGSGQSLVLLHGLGGDRCVWEPLLDELAADHDVIAVDLPGFGRSAPLERLRGSVKGRGARHACLR